MFAKTRTWSWLLQLKDSCLPAHSASLLTSVTLAAGVSHTTWDGKRISDPSAKDNRKYDMGTSQLSGSPTLNTTSQTSEGIPSFNLGVSSWLKELPLFLFFLLPPKHNLQHRLKVENDGNLWCFCRLSGQWPKGCLSTPISDGKEDISMRVSRQGKLCYKSELKGRDGHSAFFWGSCEQHYEADIFHLILL